MALSATAVHGVTPQREQVNELLTDSILLASGLSQRAIHHCGQAIQLAESKNLHTRREPPPHRPPLLPPSVQHNHMKINGARGRFRSQRLARSWHANPPMAQRRHAAPNPGSHLTASDQQPVASVRTAGIRPARPRRLPVGRQPAPRCWTTHRCYVVSRKSTPTPMSRASAVARPSQTQPPAVELVGHRTGPNPTPAPGCKPYRYRLECSRRLADRRDH